MNNHIERLYNIASKKERLIIGLMSGTSLDGLDIALCKCSHSGLATEVEVVHFNTIAYADDFKNEVKSIFSKRTVDLQKVCLLNEWIATQHATMINDCLKKWNIESTAIDLIASHGQTIYHAPKKLHGEAKFGNATLQIGDGDHLAVATKIITISDFRQKHIAAGGEGAPLALYGDYLLFSNKDEARIMLNIGGIANFTFLPTNASTVQMFSSDTGPGNTIMDAYIQQNFDGKSFDENGSIAQQGKINNQLLSALKQHSFFEQGFPKTTGPELFNLAYLEEAKQKADVNTINHFDTMATLNRFTADTIVHALQQTMQHQSYTVYSSGGGMHNAVLMQSIQQQLPNASFKNIADLKINPDAKEAVLFAVLANECVSGNASTFANNITGIPNVTMGKISFPA